jgi:small conductance mechanosensitive channel
MNFTQLADGLATVSAVIGAAILAFIPRLAAALVIAVVGYLVAGWISRTACNVVVRTGRLEPTLIPVIGATIRYTFLIVLAIAALAQPGVETTSLLAALGAAGIAIALALQGTLQNIAAGIMLLWLRPFRVGDFIETPTVAGTVEEVHLFATQMRTGDGVYKFVPNSELWNRIVTNFSRNGTRQVNLPFHVPYDKDIAAARRVLQTVAESDSRVLKSPPVEVVPAAIGDAAVTLELRAWTASADYWATRWDLTERGKGALEHAGAAGPVPRVVQVIGTHAEAAA